MLGAATEEIGLNTSKTATRTVAHKAAEATEEFIGNKICSWCNFKIFQKSNYVIIPPEQEEILRRNIEELKTNIKWNTIKSVSY